jgi:hypothetical protein
MQLIHASHKECELDKGFDIHFEPEANSRRMATEKAK